jgi:CheY-like chemotaxis protein
MVLPTEPMGSIPRPLELIQAIGMDGDGTNPKLESLYEAAIRDTTSCFELVLLDIGMPGTNGYEVARKIRLASPGAEVKLIAITGWGQEADKQKAFAAGFDHHLTKPVDTQQLSQLIEA